MSSSRNISRTKGAVKKGSSRLGMEKAIASPKSPKILVYANLDKIYAYTGLIGFRISLESLLKDGVSNKYIVITSDYRPKNLVLVQDNLPIATYKFQKLTQEETSKLFSGVSNENSYIARIEAPKLLRDAIDNLWHGEFIVSFESYGQVEFACKKKSKDDLINNGDPNEFKQSIDRIYLKPDLKGGAILEVEGWVLSSAVNNVQVFLYFDGVKVNSTATTKMRPDVLKAHEIHKAITPGFMVDAKLPIPAPKSVGVMFKTPSSSMAFKIEFEKIPGSNTYIKVEDTIFNEFLADSSKPLRKLDINRFYSNNTSSFANKFSYIIPTKLSTDNIYDLAKAIRDVAINDEIIILGHDVSISDREKLSAIADKYIHVSGKFNWSKFNNKGASLASNRHIVFMNDDVLPIAQNWRHILDNEFDVKESNVGVVGARLVGKDLKIQHDGIALYGKSPYHINLGEKDFLNLFAESARVDAVTGAFLATTKEVFNKLGGFDEELDIIGNDLDFCLRVGTHALDIVLPSGMIMYHAEGSSRANMVDNNIDELLDQRLPKSGRLRALDASRYIDLSGEKISIMTRRSLTPKNIALIKIDHIGDFYATYDAFEKIRNNFPNSFISLICSPEVSEVAKSLGFFNEVIPVRIFNKTSGLGLDFKSLPRSISRSKYDVAIDLRKHEDARVIFENINADVKFCFSEKTAATSNEIICFKGHIEKGGDEYQAVISDEFAIFADFIVRVLNNYAIELDLNEIKEYIKPSISLKKNISIFPLAGNISRTYPLALYMQYAIYQKLLMPKVSINFYLPIDKIGDYVSIDNINILKESGISVVGLNHTHQMVEAIKASDLVVANNSGPMWAASIANVPSISIKSGVISKTHWLPASSYQITRDVTCSPCYQEASGCHRNLYCLNSIDPSYINLLTNYVLSKDLH